MTDSKIHQYIELIRWYVEGGYFHPDMYIEDPKFFEGYATSGETIFGLDRKNGDLLNKTAEGIKFWQIVDANFKGLNKKKYWNEKADGKGAIKNAEVGKELKRLSDIIFTRQFKKLMNENFNAKQQQRIYNNPKLFLNFLYGTWNGSGNFKHFANKFKANENLNDEDLNNVILNYRANNFVYPLNTSKSKLLQVYNTTAFKNLESGSGGGSMKWLILAAGVAAIYYILKK